MTDATMPRPPLAVVALAAILVITAGWWALALWPLGAGAPEWIVVARDVCFGASRTGLPNAGGWLLLVGEPIGMFAVLYVVWGVELRAGLAKLHRGIPGRLTSTLVVLLGVSGLLATARRVASVGGLVPADESFAVSSPLPARGSAPATPLALIDQHGAVARLDAYRGQWVMVTFAFGHCEDICPLIVQQARRARSDEGAEQVPLLVVTLDPWRDTPERLGAIATAWELGPQDRMLSGTVDEVNAALDVWRIARERDPDNGMVLHGSTIVLVDPEGREAWRIEGAPQRVREALAIVVRESRIARVAR